MSDGIPISHHPCAASAEDAARMRAEALADRIQAPVRVDIQSESGRWYCMGIFRPASTHA